MESKSNEPTTDRKSASPETDENLLLTNITRTSENWRGKNSPSERRRIQNRLNQRAYRERRRTGTSLSPHPQSTRSTSGSSSQRAEDQTSEEDKDDSEPHQATYYGSHLQSKEPTASTSTTSFTSDLVETGPGETWDELALLINRNLMAAASTNATHLNLDPEALKIGQPALTPRSTVPLAYPSLEPVDLQYQTPHDTISDTIPHAQLRFNILRAISTEQVDSVALGECLRASGEKERVGAGWQRKGLVVWGAPEDVDSWEVSEAFLRKYTNLLIGCEDLVEGTNRWRRRRGEGELILEV